MEAWLVSSFGSSKGIKTTGGLFREYRLHKRRRRTDSWLPKVSNQSFQILKSVQFRRFHLETVHDEVYESSCGVLADGFLCPLAR